ncbi:MAG: VanZ family protein [Phycisphaerales bacterium]|jgi:VanZ family protein|nr:VanZ family protein [Phycisphaerales bacterium]MBT7171352.1 VanZ family protein [Phycisphaerales bacterium]
MPWEFSLGMEAATQKFHRAFTYFPLGPVWPGGRDLISNIILYVPLGFLLTTRIRFDRFTSPNEAVTYTIFAGAALSLLVESIQLFEPTRDSGIHDFLTNVAGTAAGAFAARSFGRRYWILARRAIRRSIAALPYLGMAVAVAVYWMADQLFPYWPTLKLKLMNANFQNSSLTVSDGLTKHSTSYWLWLRAMPAAILVLLLAGAIGKRSFRWRLAILSCVVFATVVETAKILLPADAMNVAQIAVVTFGAIGAALVGGILFKRLTPQSRFLLGGLACAGYCLARGWCESVYIGPADWQTRLPQGAAWLPLYHYADASPSDLLNFFQTIALGAALTLCWAGARRPARLVTLRALLLTLRWGLLVEAGQLLLANRYATTTDLLCYLLGGLVGAFMAQGHFFHRLLGPTRDLKQKTAPAFDEIFSTQET